MAVSVIPNNSFDCSTLTPYGDGSIRSYDPTAALDPSATYTPLRQMSFNSGTPDALADGADAFTTPFPNTKYSTAQAYGGSGQSVICECPVGGNGFGSGGWGAEEAFTVPERLVQGDTLWVRQRVYVESSANRMDNVGFLKDLRFTVEDPDIAVQGGRVDLLIDESDNSYIVGNEIDYPSPFTGALNGDNPGYPSNSYVRTRDTWITEEMACKFHLTDGWVRVWREGVLIYEATGLKTLKTVNSYVSGLLFSGTYWNGGAVLTLANVIGGSFSVSDTLSSDNAGGGTAGASFSTAQVDHGTDASGNKVLGLVENNIGYGLAAGDVVTNGLGVFGTVVRAKERSWYDDIIVATDKAGYGRPTATDAAGNFMIGPLAVAA